MAIRIQERFEVAAPPDRVWSYLVDPTRVVRCLPGAELLEVTADGGFLGRMKVKVGPVTTAYKGKARFLETDAAQRRARLTGAGQETAGAGSARMTMTSEVVELPGGRTEVRVDVDVDVVGKVVQFGRGLIEEVSRQLFRQFAECARATLEATGPAQAAGTAAVVGAAPAPAGMATATPAASGAAAAPPTAAVAAAPAPAQPLRVLPVLWAAFVAWIRRVFGGKRPTA
ncbi:MAG TPA: SRPBCC family protein [Longimicrobiales bacterium]|nr:SRPBCC family protein [Longimicrobiales bacterium]